MFYKQKSHPNISYTRFSDFTPESEKERLKPGEITSKKEHNMISYQ